MALSGMAVQHTDDGYSVFMLRSDCSGS